MFATPTQMAMTTVTQYWDQFSHAEVRSMHGIDNDIDDEDDEADLEIVEDQDDDDQCPRCMGMGCNYCLMCDY